MRFHGDLQEPGCVFNVRELVARQGLDSTPVWVFDGYLHQQGDGFSLHIADDPAAPFVQLDLAKLPASEIPYGLVPLVSWRTRVIGYYTSGDVAAPLFPGAEGTLQVLSIGYLRDPDRPRGAYDEAARVSSLHSSEEGLVQVVSIHPTVVDPSTGGSDRAPDDCGRWSLTPAQAETFFALSAEVDARIYHHDYETSRCMIKGELMFEGQRWDFQINGASKAYWSNGISTRYFGCDASGCESLALAPYIGLNP